MSIQTPHIAVDGIVEIYIAGEFRGVVLINRKNPPLGTALPGGFMEVGEFIVTALKREMREEIGLDVQIEHLLGIYSDPERDKRFHAVSAVYVASANAYPQAGSDALNVKVVTLDQLLDEALLFDHAQIIFDYLEYKNSPFT